MNAWRLVRFIIRMIVPIAWTTIASVMIASLMASVPAAAFDTAALGQGGSTTMQDIMPLIGQSPKLRHEVMEAAAKLGKKPAEIVCGGMRFSGSWQGLSGYRVSPYVCAFGDDRFLEIRAKVRITSVAGKDFEKTTPEAMKSASKIYETHPTWNWLSEDPRLLDRR